MNLKRWRYILIIIVFVFVIGELVGRYYGLCSYPLYIESDEYEYIHAPNQDLMIYGNHFITNEYSMRSAPIDLEKDTSVVLLIGDSVINGGNLTDHEDLASTILEKRLSKHFGKSIRVLNISAGSWGPDNGAAYVKKHGMFNADVIVLVVNSGDAYDNMTFEGLLGQHISHPKKQVPFAWNKLYAKVVNWLNPPPFKETTDLRFNTGFDFFVKKSNENNIPIIIYLHAVKREIKRNNYYKQGKKIINFCEVNRIPLVKELDLVVGQSHLLDHIHYNKQGQQFLAENLFLRLEDITLDSVE